MSPLEALLLFLSLAWLLTDVERSGTGTALDDLDRGCAVGHQEGVLEQVQRAEQRLQQLTDQAVLAMVAELRRQLGDDW